MAGGKHGAGQTEGAGGVVEAVGRTQPDLDDINSFARDSIGERRNQVGATRAHIVTHHDGSGAAVGGGNSEHSHHGRANRVGKVAAELLRDEPTNVVGLNEGIEIDHSVSLVVERTRPTHSYSARGATLLRTRGVPTLHEVCDVCAPRCAQH